MLRDASRVFFVQSLVNVTQRFHNNKTYVSPFVKLGSVVEVFWEVEWGLGMVTVAVIHPVFHNFPLLSAVLAVAATLARYPRDYQQFRRGHLVAVRVG